MASKPSQDWHGRQEFEYQMRRLEQRDPQAAKALHDEVDPLISNEDYRWSLVGQADGSYGLLLARAPGHDAHTSTPSYGLNGHRLISLEQHSIDNHAKLVKNYRPEPQPEGFAKDFEVLLRERSEARTTRDRFEPNTPAYNAQIPPVNRASERIGMQAADTMVRKQYGLDSKSRIFPPPAICMSEQERPTNSTLSIAIK